mmetsp:Transcript_7263/g.24719  ORF Transcript_7263/g.24719 Transcript_7263/m.24719 type:complete len:255 (-) Transcript_7263:120-884(-)
MPSTCSTPTTATATPPGPRLSAASQQRCARISLRSAPRSGLQAPKTAAAAVFGGAESPGAASSAATASSAPRTRSPSAGSPDAAARSTASASARASPSAGPDGAAHQAATAALTHRFAVAESRRSRRCVCARRRLASWAAAAWAAPRHAPWPAATPSASRPPRNHHAKSRSRLSPDATSYDSGLSGSRTEPSARSVPRSMSSQTGGTRSAQSCSSTLSGVAARMRARTFAGWSAARGATPTRWTTDPLGLRSST